MAAAALGVVIVVVALAQLVLSAQRTSDSSARQRFENGAVVRGQLTTSLLSTSSASLRATAPKLAVSAAALDRFAKASHLGYAAMLSADGTLLAASSGASRATTKRLAARPRHVGQGRYVASAQVDGTGWRIVRAQPTSLLYTGVNGARSWLLWVVVVLAGAVGCASLIPLRRSQVRAAQLRAAHTEVSALNATLEAKVAERTELAERRAHALQRSNAELEQFASVAAHDLQEPLRKIRMYCERLERRRDEIPEEMRDDIARMGAASERMRNLISDLLDLARVNSRGRELVSIALTDVAREVVSDLEPRAAEVGATIEIDQLPVVLGDRVQLRQILQNLIGNALKFHREDVPLKVRVTTEANEGGRCTVAVGDNGIGLDEKYADRIFGTFQRLHGREEYEGTGIGLSIARKIAWRHDGDISATGVLGEGTTFHVTLPLAPLRATVLEHADDVLPERESERSIA